MDDALSWAWLTTFTLAGLLPVLRLRSISGTLYWVTGYVFYGLAGLLLFFFPVDSGVIHLVGGLLCLIAAVCMILSFLQLAEQSDRSRPVYVVALFGVLGFAFVDMVDGRYGLAIGAAFHALLWLFLLLLVVRLKQIHMLIKLPSAFVACSIVILSVRPVFDSAMFSGHGDALYGMILYAMLPGTYLLLLLDRMLAERNALALRLEETERNHAQFVSIVSHDIGGSLAAVEMGLHVLTEENAPASRRMNAEETDSLLSMLRASVERIHRLQKDLIEWYRLQGRHRKPVIEPIDSRDLLMPVIENFREEIKRKHITFQVDVRSDASTLECDVDDLRSVFRILLANAVCFTPDHGRVSVQVFRAGGWCLRVFNSGSVMPEGIMERVRAGLKVVPAKTTSGESGSGMGLLLASAYLRHSNALLEVQNVADGVESLVRVP